MVRKMHLERAKIAIFVFLELKIFESSLIENFIGPNQVPVYVNEVLIRNHRTVKPGTGLWDQEFFKYIFRKCQNKSITII